MRFIVKIYILHIYGEYQARLHPNNIFFRDTLGA